MKNLTLLFVALLLITSCQKEAPKDYVTFSGKITDKNSDSIVLSSRKAKFKRVIKVNKDGTFKDTFKLKKHDFITLFDGKEYGILFLRNGDDVKMTLDTKMFDESISFEGKGASESNFIAKKNLMEEDFLKDDSLFYNSEMTFKEKYRAHNESIIAELQKSESIDSFFLKKQDKDIENFEKYLNKTFENKHYIVKNLSPGTPSPEFSEAYESFSDGSKKLLKDFKGKYVYIEFWATWCGYCKQEIPHLKKLAEEYKDKNITFVGVSVDKKEKYDQWKKMVEEKQLPGVQLFFNGDREFIKKYRVSGIPRFVILDPDGNIVNAEAPAPSNEKIKESLNKLDLNTK